MCWDPYCAALWWWFTHCCPASEDIPIPEIPAEVLAGEVAAEAAQEFEEVITDPKLKSQTRLLFEVTSRCRKI